MTVGGIDPSIVFSACSYSLLLIYWYSWLALCKGGNSEQAKVYSDILMISLVHICVLGSYAIYKAA